MEVPAEEGISENDNWKLKYYNDMDMQERLQQQLRERLAQTQENEQILTIELEEVRKELDEKIEEIEFRPAAIEKTPAEDAARPVQSQSAAEPAAEYLVQLKSAQENLFEHNNNIHRLLDQIAALQESESKYQNLQKVNEQLNEQLKESNRSLADKESEIKHARQQQKLAEEITTRLDKAYEEYNVLQSKLQKLDGYLGQPHKKSAEYEELQDSYFKLTKEFDEMKLRQISLRDENQRLSRILADTEDKLREANFQRQQFQKRAAFLEELNNDLQQVSEHNKKLEGQLRRISEMETLLAKATKGK
jgi:DNA repair exonuclease SbcCD ATPase subunit